MKKKTIIILALILLMLAGVASAHPGIYLTVDPIKDSVKSGETAKYLVTVHTTPDVSDTENVHLYIDNPLQDWVYTFTPNDFDIFQDPDTKTSILEVYVPPGTVPEVYTTKINANTTYGGISDWETTDFTTYVNV